MGRGEGREVGRRGKGVRGGKGRGVCGGRMVGGQVTLWGGRMGGGEGRPRGSLKFEDLEEERGREKEERDKERKRGMGMERK